MRGDAKWFRNQLAGEGFIACLSVESPERNYILVRTTDVLESSGVPELHNGTQKIAGLELSFHMNGDSIFNGGRMKVWRENGTAMDPENIAGFTIYCSAPHSDEITMLSDHHLV